MNELLSFEEEDGAVAKVEVDEVFRFCEEGLLVRSWGIGFCAGLADKLGGNSFRKK